MAESFILDVVKIVDRLQSIGFCLDLDVCSKAPRDLRPADVRRAFDQVLELFVSEIHPDHPRPLPVSIGGAVGQPVDLFKLSLVVRGKGGSAIVSSDRSKDGSATVSSDWSWREVAGEIGLEPAVGASLKLVYVKYVDAFDRWLREVLDETAPPAQAPTGLGLLKSDEGNAATSHKKKDAPGTSPGAKRDLFLSSPGKRNGDKLEIDEDAVDVQEGAAGNGAPSLKRKRDDLDLAGMLNWVKSVARNRSPNPDDQSLSKIIASKGKFRCHTIADNFVNAVRVRKAMFVEIPQRTTDESLGQGAQESDYPYADLRGARNQSGIGFQTDSGSILERCTLDYLMKKAQKADGDELLSHIQIGRSYQANVPKWTSKPSPVSDSDSLKWLGTEIWHPESQVMESANEQHPIQNGKTETCQCERRASVECVRLHVAEKRFSLMRELGSSFSSWGFDDMGEEVALRWTEEEQQKFKDVARQNPPSKCDFWDVLKSAFPLKGMKNLVSYFFNVFVVERRAYQNRVNPKRFDTDDDDTEYAFLSKPYGHDAVRLLVSKKAGTQNTQRMDWEVPVNGDSVQDADVLFVD